MFSLDYEIERFENKNSNKSSYIATFVFVVLSLLVFILYLVFMKGYKLQSNYERLITKLIIIDMVLMLLVNIVCVLFEFVYRRKYLKYIVMLLILSYLSYNLFLFSFFVINTGLRTDLFELFKIFIPLLVTLFFPFPFMYIIRLTA